MIARSNGSRSLLHLPSSFGPQTSVTDMVVSTAPSAASYLACVTSDGGLVVWDVPGELDENPPVPVVLHVAPPPATPSEAPYALRLVKWHPRALGIGSSSSGDGGAAGTIAVASDREVYVFNVSDALERFRGEEITLSSLATIASVISVPSPLVGFTFDLNSHATTNAPALATISIDSTIMLWNIKDRLPFWTGRVPGEGLPSSIDFLDGGLLVGRKQGTILQLLPVMSASVAATIKLVTPLPSNGGRDGKGKEATSSLTDEESIFAHVGYDPRIRTIWVAHSGRPSLFAIRLGFDAVPAPVSMEGKTSSITPTTTVPVIDQIIEFPIPMQCINMAILISSPYAPDGTIPLSALPPTSSSYDLTGNSSVPLTYGPDLVGGGDGYIDANGNPLMAVASFAMHQGGVDQINIAMGTFEQALGSVSSKLPLATYGPDGQSQQPLQAVSNTGAGSASWSAGSKKASGGQTTTTTTTNAPVTRGGATAPAGTSNVAFPVEAPSFRPRSPPSDIGEGLQQGLGDAAIATSALGAASNSNKRGGKGKDKDASAAKPVGPVTSAKEKEKATAGAGAKAGATVSAPAGISEVKLEAGESTTSSPALGAKDLRRVEDNLHSRIGKLLTKELERQREYSRLRIFCSRRILTVRGSFDLSLSRTTHRRTSSCGPRSRLCAPRDDSQAHLDRAH